MPVFKSRLFPFLLLPAAVAFTVVVFFFTGLPDAPEAEPGSSITAKDTKDAKGEGVAGSLSLDTGYWSLDAGSRMQDAGDWSEAVVPGAEHNTRSERSDKTGREAGRNNPERETRNTDRRDALADFDAWLEEFQYASPEQRVALVSRGAELARDRRQMMAELIRNNPEEALRLAVPRHLHRRMPEEIARHLETPIDATGDFLVTVACGEGSERRAESEEAAILNIEPGALTPARARPTKDQGQGTKDKVQRTIQIGDDTYEAFVFGRRQHVTTKFSMPVHGIALEGKMALHDESFRILEPEELAMAGLREDVLAAQVGEEIEPFASPAEMTLRIGELAEIEQQPSPYAFYGREDSAIDGEPESPEATATSSGDSWTMGTQPVLIIRVDFEDKPGDPVTLEGDIVTQAYAEELMDSQVGPFFETMSYHQVSIPATVTDVYRMPQTAEDYGNRGPLTDHDLHRHAREAAADHHDLAGYSRIMVVFSRLAYMYHGKAQVGGPYAWINGGFTAKIVAHELGHTFGLRHAGDYEGPGGETGDPFDVMGSGHPPDGHFNMASKYRLGWLPESAVRTITQSGIYRVYRFDHPDASFDNVLALRLSREGAQHYWIGMRQNYHDHAEGAIVLYTLLSRKTVLGPNNVWGDLSLRIGQTYTSSVAPVTMKTLARGGEYPNEWLDVEISITPPSGPVIAWGRSDHGQTEVPPNLGEVVDIAAGGHNSVAIRADGTIRLWGELDWGLDQPPDELTNVAKVAISPRHALALSHEGELFSWGSNAYDLQQIPPELEGYTVLDIAVGDFHSLALREDGRVIAWGHNMFGETTPPEDLADAVAVAAGYHRSVALTVSGRVVAWGQTSGSVSLPPDSLTDAEAISGTGTNFLALRADGTVVRWGSDHQDALPPTDLSDVTAISAGAGHSLALDQDRELAVWGTNNWSGQLNAPQWARRGQAVAAGREHSLLLRPLPIPFETWASRANLPEGFDGPFDDPDGDGRPNLLEYALGTDPMRATTGGGPNLSRAENGGHVFRFFRPDYVTGIGYHVEVSEDLVNWTQLEAFPEQWIEEGEIWAASLPEEAARQFVRLRVEME